MLSPAYSQPMRRLLLLIELKDTVKVTVIVSIGDLYLTFL